jgi:3-phenylpropionate/trans-cinnamate dioxygenase ferredoxin component
VYNYTKYPVTECEFIDIASVEEIGIGERLFVEIDEIPIVIFNIGGQIFAIQDICSHDDGPLGEGDLEDHKIICPRHGGVFDVRTGKVLSLPAIVDIPAYPTMVNDGKIQIGLPIK